MTACKRLTGAALVGLALLLACPEFVSAQTKTKAKNKKPAAETTGPSDYKSKNFVLHTDLKSDEAEDLLVRLETMLPLISKYWGRPPSGIIECFVVKDMKKWPAGSLDPDGVQSIEGGGGVTLGRVLSNRATGAFLSKAPVYATADHGTPQHEAVHAYCIQAFGRTGPTWYAEGMAEMGQYWKDGDSSVNCHEVVVEYLKSREPKDLLEIVDVNDVTGDSWQNYAWRWALCHLLANNPNYAPRFRPLGMGLLTDQDVSFESVYGNMAKEIQFEYEFFLKHFDRGYRVDLCSFDWKAHSGAKTLKGSISVAPKIDANKGWQASRVKVSPNDEYEYSVTGTWKTAKEGDALTAEGGEEGAGKLVGMILSDYTMSEPFELGEFGAFRPPTEGHLFLRCQDKWPELADNSGKLTVKMKVKGQGPALQPPKKGPAGGAKPVEKDADSETTEEDAAKPKPAPKRAGGAKPVLKPAE